MGRKEVLCTRCKFPLRFRGRLPVIFPAPPDGKCVPYCSVKCFEDATNITLPEPMRSNHLRVENG